jgi:selT/selW/selH-like putative selenoprotein
MGYAQRAASLADRLRIDLGADVTLEEGGKGAFDILSDDRLIYSKLETRRVPNPEQILALLRKS